MRPVFARFAKESSFSIPDMDIYWQENPDVSPHIPGLKRVALARLWLSRSVTLWVLDEPFTALDVRGVARLADLVGEHVRSGGIVMLVTHQEVPVDGVEYLVIEPERWSPRRRTAVEAALDNESALEADNAR